MNVHEKNGSQTCLMLFPPLTVRFRIFTVMNNFDDTTRMDPLDIEIVVLCSL